MEAGTLVEWLVQPGERVKGGDVIATVETQKGLFEIENFEEGIMGEPLVQPGQKVPVGTVLAMIHAEGAPITPAEASTEAAEAPVAEVGTDQPSLVTPPTVASPQPSSAPSERVAASPSARKLAAELGVDLGTVRGSGPHGAIQRVDVEQAAQASGREPPARVEPPPPGTLKEGMRQAIAAAMSRSNREIPHYYLEMEIDMSRPLHWLEGENLKRPIRERILPAALLLKGAARALGINPHTLRARMRKLGINWTKFRGI